MMNYKPIYPDKFVERAELNDYDFRLSDFPARSVWTEKDLSAIAPKGTRAVLWQMFLSNDSGYNDIFLRKKGSTSEFNTFWVQYTFGSGVHVYEGLVFVDKDCKIEYFINGTGNLTDMEVYIRALLI